MLSLNKIYVIIDIKKAQIAVTPYLLKNDFQLIDDLCVIDRLRPAINKKLEAIIRSKSRQSGSYIKSGSENPKYIKSKAKWKVNIAIMEMPLITSIHTILSVIFDLFPKMWLFYSIKVTDLVNQRRSIQFYYRSSM